MFSLEESHPRTRRLKLQGDTFYFLQKNHLSTSESLQKVERSVVGGD